MLPTWTYDPTLLVRHWNSGRERVPGSPKSCSTGLVGDSLTDWRESLGSTHRHSATPLGRTVLKARGTLNSTRPGGDVTGGGTH